MLTVYKYPISAKRNIMGNGVDYANSFELTIPSPGIITRIGLQESRSTHFQIWVLVDPTKELVTRKFVLLGTGNATDETKLAFVDSWITDKFVLHLFEVIK